MSPLVLVPIGGGGLASGVAVAIKARSHPDARVIGVEPELAADARESPPAGRIVALGGRAGVADHRRRRRGRSRSGARPFAHLRALLDGIVTVTEAEIAAGVRLAAERSRLVVEPSGALAVAALASVPREAGSTTRRRAVVAVVSGGNVDPARYLRLAGVAAPRLSVASRRRAARRSARRASRRRISARSTAARRSSARRARAPRGASRPRR